jgi:hypothetical protein
MINIFVLLAAFSGSASDKPSRSVAEKPAAVALAEPDEQAPVVQPPDVRPDDDDEPRIIQGLLTAARPATKAELAATAAGNWCKPGHLVMIPDGREGRVTSVDGAICRVLAYGEGYVSVWTYDLVEPVYPSEFPGRNASSHGH